MKTAFLEAILAIVGFISLASLGAILLFIPAPAADSARVLEPALATLSAFLFLVSAFTFGGLAARKKFVTAENKKTVLAISFREAILLSFLAVVYVWLARFGVFKVWTVLPLALIIIGTEYIMLIRKRLWTR